MLFFVFSKRKTKRETEAKDGTDACAKLTSVDSSGVFLSMASSVVLLSSSYYSRVRAVRVFFFAVSLYVFRFVIITIKRERVRE